MDTDYKEPYRTADVHEYVHLIINEVAPEYESEFGYRYDIPSSEMSFAVTGMIFRLLRCRLCATCLR